MVFHFLTILARHRKKFQAKEAAQRAKKRGAAARYMRPSDWGQEEQGVATEQEEGAPFITTSTTDISADETTAAQRTTFTDEWRESDKYVQHGPTPSSSTGTITAPPATTDMMLQTMRRKPFGGTSLLDTVLQDADVQAEAQLTSAAAAAAAPTSENVAGGVSTKNGTARDKWLDLSDIPEGGTTELSWGAEEGSGGGGEGGDVVDNNVATGTHSFSPAEEGSILPRTRAPSAAATAAAAAAAATATASASATAATATNAALFVSKGEHDYKPPSPPGAFLSQTITDEFSEALDRQVRQMTLVAGRDFGPPKTTAVAQKSSWSSSPAGGAVNISSSSPSKPSSNNPQLLVLRFLKDVTDDILASNVHTDRALYRIIDRHADRNIYQLPEAALAAASESLAADLGMAAA